MRLLTALLIAGCLITVNVYGLDQETRNDTVKIYNFTRNQYALVLQVLDELKNSQVEASTVEKKLLEWELGYFEKTESVPQQANAICVLMYEIMDLAKEIAHYYRPNHQETKDRFDELDELKREFLNEMTELRHLVQ